MDSGTMYRAPTKQGIKHGVKSTARSGCATWRLVVMTVFLWGRVLEWMDPRSEPFESKCPLP